MIKEKAEYESVGKQSMICEVGREETKLHKERNTL